MDNNALPQGIKKSNHHFSLVWLAPILALIITSGMIYKSYTNKGTLITIIVDSGDGIKDGKTPVMYKGIKIGVVEQIAIKDDDVSKLMLTARIDKRAAESITRKGNQFWLVKPKVSITEVSGLDTIISGVYIAVMPGATTFDELLSLPYQDEFVAVETEPIDVFNPGLSLVVSTINKGDVAIEAPVLYNKQVIGKVIDKKLSDDNEHVDIYLHIESKYTDLIHTDSIFYKMDALEVKASLDGIKVNMGSLASFITGGIGLVNTQESLGSAQADNHHAYKLFDSLDDTKFDQEPVILTMQTKERITEEMTKVYFQGVEAGLVKELVYHAQNDQTRITVLLNKTFRGYANEEAYFWLASPKVGFDAMENLDTVIRGNYINFTTKKLEAERKSNFELHAFAPQPKGITIVLHASDIKSLQRGAGVFYHNIKVGQLQTITLDETNTGFKINVLVFEKYTHLINQSSYFYFDGGIDVSASLDSLSINTGSLESLVRGGISLDTKVFPKTPKRLDTYKLYASKGQKEQEDRFRQKGLHVTLHAKQIGSLHTGAPILFKQAKVGEIRAYQWKPEQQLFLIDAFIDEKYAQELSKDSLFFNASGIRANVGLEGLQIKTESISSIIDGGVAFITPKHDLSTVAKQNAVYTLYESEEEALESYVDIQLTANESAGLKQGSAITYKSMVIGYVDDLTLKADQVMFDVKIKEEYAHLMNEYSLFWVEGFTMGVNGVTNPGAVLTGPRIAFKPGSSSKTANTFELFLNKPSKHHNEPGLRIFLQAPRLGSISIDTPVYFRQIEIGSVTSFALNHDASGINVELFIEPCYAHLIQKDSHFYNASGVGMEVDLFSAKVQTESMTSILSGGIGVLTPQSNAPKAQLADSFILHDDFEPSMLEWKPALYPQESVDCRP